MNLGLSAHGRRSRETRGTSPPEFGVGDANVNCPLPLRFLSYRYKKDRSVAFKIRQNPFSDPAGGADDAPRPPIRLERGHPSPYSTSLGTDPTSALAMRSPQNSSQIYAYVSALWSLTLIWLSGFVLCKVARLLCNIINTLCDVCGLFIITKYQQNLNFRLSRVLRRPMSTKIVQVQFLISLSGNLSSFA